MNDKQNWNVEPSAPLVLTMDEIGKIAEDVANRISQVYLVQVDSMKSAIKKIAVCHDVGIDIGKFQNGHKLDFILVDEAKDLCDVMDELILEKLKGMPEADFKRAVMNSPIPHEVDGLATIEDILKEISTTKIEAMPGRTNRGKWKGRRAVERGWRR